MRYKTVEYHTKEQTAMLMAAWGHKGPPPKKGEVVKIEFPFPALPAKALIAKAGPEKKSTYGKPLYRITHYTPIAEAPARIDALKAEGERLEREYQMQQDGIPIGGFAVI